MTGGRDGLLPPAWSTDVIMDGTQDVWLLDAWNSCCRSVKKIPMDGGNARVIASTMTVPSSTTQPQPPSGAVTAPGAGTEVLISPPGPPSSDSQPLTSSTFSSLSSCSGAVDPSKRTRVPPIPFR